MYTTQKLQLGHEMHVSIQSRTKTAAASGSAKCHESIPPTPALALAGAAPRSQSFGCPGRSQRFVPLSVLFLDVAWAPIFLSLAFSCDAAAFRQRQNPVLPSLACMISVWRRQRFRPSAATPRPSGTIPVRPSLARYSAYPKVGGTRAWNPFYKHTTKRRHACDGLEQLRQD